jgi:hypothetical protein
MRYNALSPSEGNEREFPAGLSGCKACLVRLIAGLLCAVLVAITTAPAFAQDNPDGVVAVGGSHILTVRFPAGGMSVKERADAITERLRTFLGYENLKPSEVTVKRLNRNSAQILVRDKLFVTVTQEAARYNHTIPMALANNWAKNVRRVLLQHNVTPGTDVPVPPQ